MTGNAQDLASRGKRLGGALLDSLIGLSVTLPILFLTGFFDRLSERQPVSIAEQGFFFVLGLVLFVVVNGYLLAQYGQTLGKRMVGTRIVSAEHGTLLPFNRLFILRYALVSLISQIPIAGTIFAITDVLFVFRDDRRCLHDLIAGTVVVDA